MVNPLEERLAAEDEIDPMPDVQRIEAEMRTSGAPSDSQMMAYGYTLVRCTIHPMQTKGLAILKSTPRDPHVKISSDARDRWLSRSCVNECVRVDLHAQHPTNRDYLFYLGLGYFRVKHYAEAKQIAEELMRLDNSNQQALQLYELADEKLLRGTTTTTMTALLLLLHELMKSAP